MRLEVFLSETEMAEIEHKATAAGLSVGEWVRRTLRSARAQRSLIPPERKLNAIRTAAAFSFPAGDIDRMLAEINRGYES